LFCGLLPLLLIVIVSGEGIVEVSLIFGTADLEKEAPENLRTTP
jgi:hypothetical protein